MIVQHFEGYKRLHCAFWRELAEGHEKEAKTLIWELFFFHLPVSSFVFEPFMTMKG